jgi:uncharacterized membrane protein
MIALALLAVGASFASLYVHYRLVADPQYISFCDVSETVSCQAVMTSRFGYVSGIPVAAGGAVWSVLVLLLAVLGMRPPQSEAAGRAAGYIFLLSTLGLAAVLYLGYASFFVLGQACLLCVATYVAVIGLFLVSGAAASDLGAIPRRLGADVKAVFGSPTAIAAAVGWLALTAGVLAWSPREAPVVAASAAPAAMPTETLGPNEIAQFETWLAAQPRQDLDVPAGAGARVVVVKFNDYQCPACRQAYVAYKAIQQKYETEHPGQVAFVNLDYPLEAECNGGGIHAAACEAAVAVRLARGRDRSREMEEWLFDNQETLTRERVKEGLAEVAQISDFDAQYSRVLEDVRAEALMGQKLQITGTPTFFINGIRIASTLRPAYFDAAIAYELKRTQTATP